MTKNVMIMVLSVFSVQGAACVAQLLMARMLPIEQFAIVRTVEVALQIISAIAPMGISLLVVRLAAQVTDPVELRRQLTSYMVFAVVAGLASAAVCELMLALFSNRRADYYLHLLVWVVVLSNLSRTALNFFYGKERFALLSVTTFLASLCYLAILAFCVVRWQLDGWVGARYLGELLLLIVALWYIRTYLSANLLGVVAFRGLFAEGATVSLSLMFRSALDNLPLLVLTYVATNQAEVAIYGLCTLLTTAGMIIPGSINSVLVPKYGVLIKHDPAQLARRHKQFEYLVFVVGCFMAIALVLSGTVLPWILGQGYSGIVPLLTVAVLVLPLKALTGLNASLLFVNNQIHIGARINACGAIGSVVMAVLLFQNFGVFGIATAALLVEAGVAVAFRWFAITKLRRVINIG